MRSRRGWTVSALLVSGMLATSARAQTTVAQSDAENVDVSADALFQRKVTVNIVDVSLERAVQMIADAAHANVLMNRTLARQYAKTVTIRATNESVRAVFDRLFAGIPLQMIARPHGLLVLVDEVAAGDSTKESDTTGVIAGIVLDSATNKPLPRATVKVEGTRLSAVTSESGRFTIHGIGAGDRQIVVRQFGYAPVFRSVAVAENQSITLRIVMKPATNVLTGVVTTATGEQDRRSIGNDITRINADSVLRIAPVRNVTDLLANRVPGLTVQRSSGTPGAPSRIRLRGIGGLPGGNTRSNDPIVIVDGARIYSRGSTPQDKNAASTDVLDGHGLVATSADLAPTSALDRIDPNSIETIEVFKGPSATSQWGADAANGVIVITTKRGRPGTTTLNVALTQGVSQMPGMYAPQNAFVWGRLGLSGGVSALCPLSPIYDAFGNIDIDVCHTTDSVVHFQALGNPRLSPFATGTEQSASATLSGGTPAATYSLTASASKTLGYLKMPDLYQDIYQAAYGTRAPRWMRRPDGLSQWAIQATTAATPSIGLRLTAITSIDNTNQRQSSANADLVGLAETYVDTLSQQNPANRGSGAAQYYMRSTSLATTTRLTGQADWTRWRSLIATGSASVESGARTDQISFPYGIAKFPSTNGFSDSLGYFSFGHANTRTTSGNLGVTLLPQALVTTAVGINTSTTTIDNNGAYADTLQPGVDVPSTGLKGATQATSSVTTAGWYIEPRLNLHSQLFVSPGLRFDGGNAASGSGFSGGKLKGGILALFPKLNFSWIALDRSSDPDGGIVTLLRPRLAFGVAGVQPEPGQNLRLYAPTGGTGALDPIRPGIEVSAIGNSQLHPERSREIEGGFDAELWKNRVSLTVTLYDKLRTDAILPVTLPLSLGRYQFYVNAGRIRNTGQELQLTAQIVERRAVRWSMHANYSADQNRLLALTDTILKNAQSTYPSTNPLVPGYPIDGRWARPILGYTDADGNGRIEFSEVAVGDTAVFLGGSQPTYKLPFGTDVSVKGGLISLNAEFSYAHGINQLNLSAVQTLQNHIRDSTASFEEQAIARAAFACVDGIDQCDILGSRPGTQIGLFESVNALRLESVSLTIAVPERWSQRARVPHMTVALTGSNLALWTNYRGKDPDVNSTPYSELNTDNGQLPQPRRFVMRVTLGN